MNRSTYQNSSKSPLNNVFSAFTIAALLSLTFWANPSYIEQASPTIEPAFSTHYRFSSN